MSTSATADNTTYVCIIYAATTDSNHRLQLVVWRVLVLFPDLLRTLSWQNKMAAGSGSGNKTKRVYAETITQDVIS